jgi:hypothetical protein
MPGMILQVGLVWIIVAGIQFADEYGSVTPDRRKRKSNLKHWRPFPDNNHKANGCQQFLKNLVTK